MGGRVLWNSISSAVPLPEVSVPEGNLNPMEMKPGMDVQVVSWPQRWPDLLQAGKGWGMAAGQGTAGLGQRAGIRAQG